jgi:glycosyltransferase involved in cell wall biosynthesis
MAVSRILFPFTGDTVGGSHLAALELISGLDRFRFEPVIGVHEEGLLTRYLAERSLAWLKLSPLNGRAMNRSFGAEIVEIARSARKNVSVLHRQSIDLVHTNDRRMHSAWVVASKMAGVRHVIHRRTRANGFRDRLVDIIADQQIAISAATAKHRRNCANMIADPVSISAGEAEKKKSSEKIRKELGIPQVDRVVVQVCNLVEQKRPRQFVEVARKLTDFHRDNIAFIIVGDWREPEATLVRQRINDLGMSDHVFLVGPRSPIEPWIAGSDVLVSTARGEGFGRTLVEAMLCNTPVVASADGGHLEIIQSGVNGVLIELDDVNAYAQAIVRLLHDQDWRTKLTSRAHDLARELYSVERHVSEVQALYARMLKR